MWTVLLRRPRVGLRHCENGVRTQLLDFVDEGGEIADAFNRTLNLPPPPPPVVSRIRSSHPIEAEPAAEEARIASSTDSHDTEESLNKVRRHALTFQGACKPVDPLAPLARSSKS